MTPIHSFCLDRFHAPRMGRRIQELYMPFATLDLADDLVRAVDAQGYATPTPIQAQAIPVILAGRDLLAPHRLPAEWLGECTKTSRLAAR